MTDKFFDVKTKSEIKDILAQWGVSESSYHIDSDLSVTLYEKFELYRYDDTTLPFKFKYSFEDFTIKKGRLVSAKGVPDATGASFSLAFCRQISNIEYLPKIIGERKPGYMNLLGTNIKSLHNIHKYITSINDTLYLNLETTHLLGLFFIKDLKVVSSFSDANDKAYQIVTAHLTGGRDVHACQEELIEAGYVQEARF